MKGPELNRRQFGNLVKNALSLAALSVLPACATQPIPKVELDRLYPGQRVKFEQLDFSTLPEKIPYPGRVVLALRDKQVLGYYEEGILKMKTGTSTGMPEHETTLGEFRIFKRAEKYRSKKYDAPMPFMQMFTEDGQSIHESPNVGTRTYRDDEGNKKEGKVIQRAYNSHGCLGVSPEDARFLWDRMQVGDLVIIR